MDCAVCLSSYAKENSLGRVEGGIMLHQACCLGSAVIPACLSDADYPAGRSQRL